MQSLTNPIVHAWKWWFTPRSSDPTVRYRERALRLFLPAITVLRWIAITNNYSGAPASPTPYAPLWMAVAIFFIPILFSFVFLAQQKMDRAGASFILHWYLADMLSLPTEGYWYAGFQVSLILQIVLATFFLSSRAILPFVIFQFVTVGLWGGWLDVNYYDPPMLSTGQPLATFQRTILTLSAQETIFLLLIGYLRLEMEKYLRLQQVNIKHLEEEIAERHQAEARLRENEERYRLISSVISDYTFSNHLGPQGELEHALVGGAFEAITGYTPEEFNALGGWRAILHPEDVAQDEAAMARLNANQKVVTETRLLNKSGEVRWARVYAHPVWDEARSCLTGIFGAVQDITDRKRAEAGLTQRDAILEAVAFAAEQFLKTPDWQNHIGVVLERLGQKTNVSHVYISQNHLGPDGTPLTSLIHEWTAPGMTPDIDNPLFQNVPLQEAGFERWTEALKAGEPFFGSLKTFSPAEAEFIVPRGVKSLLDVPIYVDTTWWGIIGFDDYTVEREWSLAEVEALRVAAGIISAAIQRQRADAALQRSETIYRQAIMAAGAVPYQLDHMTDSFVFLGEGILQLTGYSRVEMTHQLWDSLVEEEQRLGEAAGYSHEEAIRRSRAGEFSIWQCDYRIRARDGSIRWVASAAVEILDRPGGSRGSIGILQDITERMQSAERTQSTMKGLRAVVEAADELLRAPDLDMFYRRAVELGREKLGLERCGLFLLDETQTYLLGTYGTDAHGQTTDERAAREPLAVRAALFQSGDKPWNVISVERGYWKGDQHQELSGGWVVGTAIRNAGGPIGLLYNDAALTGAPLNDVLQETVAVYCSVVGNILERKQAEGAVRQLNLQLEQRAAQLTTLNEIGRAVSTLQNLENVFELIYKRLTAALLADALLICLYDPEHDELSYPFVMDEGQRAVEASSQKRPGTWLDRVITTGESILINRTPEKVAQVIAYINAGETGSFGTKRASASLMYVPMIASSRTIGLMSVQSYTLNAFDENSLALLKGVALQAAIAIENARLFEAQQRELAERVRAEDEVRRQLNELSVLHAIGMAAAVATHADELLAHVVPIIGERLYPDIIGVLLADPATGVLRPHPASRGLRPELLHESVPPGMGIIGQVASRGQAWRIPDVRLEPAYIPINPGILSEVCVPLKTGEQVIGVINLESERVSGFSEADERLLVTIAGQLASAMEHLRAQAEIRQLNVALEQRVQERTAQFQEANRELESFSYSVSHDLRAPLRGIDGFSRILLEDYAAQLEAGGQRYLQRVRANAQRMGQLIDDLLEFSRLGRQALTLQPVDTAALVRAVLSELQNDQAQRQIDLVMGALPDCQADRALLKQVWVNLLSNALKYSSKREQARVEVGWTGEAYFVRDNGAGFDMRYADKLFGVFQRLHSADEFEGTGVGLANVKRIVERHGGRVWAEAEMDKGATFYFTLGEVK